MLKNELDRFLRPPNTTYLKKLTTRFGLVQHASGDVPNLAFGYSIDDVSRALIFCLWYQQVFQDSSLEKLIRIYLSFIESAQTTTGSFHNFFNRQGQPADEEGDEDAIGRTIWALGETIKSGRDKKEEERAQKLLTSTNTIKHLEHAHVRTKAYVLLGLLAAGKNVEAKKWADWLVERYKQISTPDWHWFEPGLYYANGIIPYALAKAARILNHSQALEIAIQSFSWLDSETRQNNMPIPIGQKGWYKKGQNKALYNQQPIEAADMIMAATELYQTTKDQKYIDTALSWFSWYEGNNLQNVTVINEETGGIHDGVHPLGLNINQGAESLVTYLMAYLCLTMVANGNRN